MARALASTLFARSHEARDAAYTEVSDWQGRQSVDVVFARGGGDHQD